mmetsp:Transcript_58576/g.104487  ORF Transcript_58576/g.104487 Transcript_58576/m.104487 type:complete len:88 (+) Transcript_58576:73-336(+)
MRALSEAQPKAGVIGIQLETVNVAQMVAKSGYPWLSTGVHQVSKGNPYVLHAIHLHVRKRERSTRNHITRQDHQVWFFNVKHVFNEI